MIYRPTLADVLSDPHGDPTDPAKRDVAPAWVSFDAVRAVRVLVDRLERHLADLDDPDYIEALNFDLDEFRRRWGMS